MSRLLRIKAPRETLSGDNTRSGDGQRNLISVFLKEVNALLTDGGCACAAGRFNSGPSRQRDNLILQPAGADNPAGIGSV